MMSCLAVCYFLKDAATTEIYTLSLHDSLPIFRAGAFGALRCAGGGDRFAFKTSPAAWRPGSRARAGPSAARDRKSTRLNSSHANISYAVFCLKKKNQLAALLDTLYDEARRSLD